MIREANQTDLTAILALYDQPDMGGSGDSVSLAEAERMFAIIRQYPAYHLYVAVENDAVIGTFALAALDNLLHGGRKTGIIEAVVVRADRQGTGVGQAMMQFAIERARALGCYKVSLSSNLKREAAHRFYEHLGYKQHGFSYYVDL
jgi:GNAT superfamily N-acetyltransferase